MSWFTESNRYKHFLLAIPAGFIFTWLFVVGLATGMEFKDVHYSNGDKPIKDFDWKNWDWLDWGCTVVGGFVGQILQGLLITIISIII